jgi:hypothetical protein
VIVVSEDFVRAASGIGQRGKLAADLHQSGRDAVSSAAAALSRQTLAQRQRDGLNFTHSAAPKSKTEFNGAGGLLTYISFTVPLGLKRKER